MILRHDVDRKIRNSLQIARIEKKLKINSSFYLKSHHIFKFPEIIKEFEMLAHEVAYHYSELTKNFGNFEKAKKAFIRNLAIIREIVDIKTISMDGIPIKNIDNKELWKHFNYKDYGINGEIYQDIDYNEFAYYTDTGRKWNNKNINVRDKVVTNKEWPVYKSTYEMMNAIQNGTFPDKAVINIHPEHWADNYFDWYKKLIWQSVKNVGKFILIKVRRLKEGR